MGKMGIEMRRFEEEINRVMYRIGTIFTNELGFKNGVKYVKGLVGGAERKNWWQMSEELGEATPYKMQQFINRGRYSADAARDEMRRYVGEEIGEEEGVLVVDDSGFIKKGRKSCGVKRQYSGTAGKVENCQIGVFLTYASSKGHTPIDRRLYIPEEWIKDKGRRDEAGVPKEREFQSKPEMGLEMMQEATKAGIAYKWVTGDCSYGDYRAIRRWLELKDKCYVMCVSGKECIWECERQITVAKVLLWEDEWFEASCGGGSKGERVYDWQAFEIETDMVSEGWKRVMLVRRSKTAPDDLRAHICYAPKYTPTEKLIEIAGIRWTVESCFEESKSEVGLAHYEVRTYNGWYRHITFACIALALLTVLSAHSFDGKPMQQHDPASSSLADFKKKRNLRV